MTMLGCCVAAGGCSIHKFSRDKLIRKKWIKALRLSNREAVGMAHHLIPCCGQNILWMIAL